MLVKITKKGAEIGRDMFQSILPYFECCLKEYSSIDDIRKNIHKDFKDEEKYILRNGIKTPEGELVNLTPEKTKSYIRSIKFLTLHMLDIAETEGVQSIQGIIDIITSKVKQMDNLSK